MPRVFISSTNQDLEDFRRDAAMAAHAAEFHADLQENWTAEDHPPLDACLERVRNADVLVVITAHRYGWVPEDQERNPEGKSITWLECEEAAKNGKHVLAFVVDEKADWPAELKDEAEFARAAALEDDEAPDALMAIHKRIRGLRAFKQWLGSRGLRRTFRIKEELKLDVENALKEWAEKHSAENDHSAIAQPQAAKTGPPPIPRTYLKWLRRECESVELLGLEAQESHPTRLSQVYVPAITPARRAETEPEALSDPREAREDRREFELLLTRLGDDSLYVPGDPGAGKSTFCRWLALVAASDTLPVHPVPDPEAYRETYPEGLRNRLPVLVPLRDFWQFLSLERGTRHLDCRNLGNTLGRWLENRAGAERVSGEDFLALLEAGRVLLILDCRRSPAHRARMGGGGARAAGSRISVGRALGGRDLQHLAIPSWSDLVGGALSSCPTEGTRHRGPLGPCLGMVWGNALGCPGFTGPERVSRVARRLLALRSGRRARGRPQRQPPGLPRRLLRVSCGVRVPHPLNAGLLVFDH